MAGDKFDLDSFLTSARSGLEDANAGRGVNPNDFGARPSEAEVEPETSSEPDQLSSLLDRIRPSESQEQPEAVPEMKLPQTDDPVPSYANGATPDQALAQSPLDAAERGALFDALLSVSEWVRIHFLWRPNLPDEADNHVIELAVASAAKAVITANLADFKRAELLFPNLTICDAGTYLKERKPT